MDDLNLAKKLLGKEITAEEKSELINSSTASVVYMVAVTSSSGGEVILKNEIETDEEWEDGTFTEVDEDGNFEEEEIEEDEEDIDNSILDTTDGDGANIEESEAEVVAFTISEYQEKAQALYAEEEAEVIEDDLADENSEITSEVDDGDAEDLPTVEEAEEDDLADENSTIAEITDNEYSLTDDNDDDVSDVIENAEASDGYTIADCIGVVNEGDRVAVLVQDGKMTVLGVAGSGDEQKALITNVQDTIEEVNELATNTSELLDDVNIAVDEATTKSNEAIEKAENIEGQVKTINTTLAPIEKDFNEIKGEEETFKAGLENVINSQVSADFASQTDLLEVRAELNSAIQQTASRISFSVSEEQINDLSAEAENSVEQARILYNSALSQYQEAVKSYELALSEKTNAETTLNNALISLNNLKTKVAEILNNENATEAQKNEAQLIQDNAQADYNNAVLDLANVTTMLNNCLADLNAAKNILDLAQTKLNECSDNKVFTKAEFEVEADNIKASVKESIEIGGRNLLLNSSFSNNFNEWNVTGNYISIVNEEIDSYGKITGVLNETSTVTQSLLSKLEVNQKYILSGWLKTNNIVQGTSNYLLSLHMDGYYSDDNILFSYGSKDISLNTAEWEYFNFEFQTDDKLKTATSYNLSILASDFTGELLFKKLKLEKGNKSTDWTPAPEDMATLETTNEIYEQLTEQEASITTTAESIILENLTSYTKNDDFNSFKEETETEMSIMKDSIDMNFTSSTEMIENVEGDIQTQLDKYSKHISFSDNGIIIKSGENAIQLQLDNEEGILFSKNGVEFGKWDGTNFYTGNIIISVNEKAQFGNFAFIPRSDGSLQFLKVGG